MPTYQVSIWDHDEQDWHCMAVRLGRWELRPWLRILFKLSYDTPSILVERED